MKIYNTFPKNPKLIATSLLYLENLLATLKIFLKYIIKICNFMLHSEFYLPTSFKFLVLHVFRIIFKIHGRILDLFFHDLNQVKVIQILTKAILIAFNTKASLLGEYFLYSCVITKVY